jgi:hypothetical protein
MSHHRGSASPTSSIRECFWSICHDIGVRNLQKVTDHGQSGVKAWGEPFGTPEEDDLGP